MRRPATAVPVRHDAAPGAPTGPVVLATLAARVLPEAEELAIASALEAGVALIVANAVRLPPYHTALYLGGPSVAVLPHEEALEEVRATARRAASFGIPVEHLRLTASKPAAALVDVAARRGAGLLILGADPQRVGRRRLRAAARLVRARADCLVWTAPGT